jgi:hypothetical protein
MSFFLIKNGRGNQCVGSRFLSHLVEMTKADQASALSISSDERISTSARPNVREVLLRSPSDYGPEIRAH